MGTLPMVTSVFTSRAHMEESGGGIDGDECVDLLFVKMLSSHTDDDNLILAYCSAAISHIHLFSCDIWPGGLMMVK